MDRGLDFLKSQINNAVMQHKAFLEAIEDHEGQAEDTRFRDLCSRHIPNVREHQRMLEDYQHVLGAEQRSDRKIAPDHAPAIEELLHRGREIALRLAQPRAGDPPPVGELGQTEALAQRPGALQVRRRLGEIVALRGNQVPRFHVAPPSGSFRTDGNALRSGVLGDGAQVIGADAARLHGARQHVHHGLADEGAARPDLGDGITVAWLGGKENV